MKVRTGFAFLFACLVAGYAAQAADASLDLIPAPGAAPIRLRFSQTSPGSENQPAPADIVLRRTGPTTAVVEQNSDVSPLVLGPDGSLHADPAATAARRGDLGDLLSAINIAHGVTGGAGAGNRAGWTAQIPAPDRPRPDGAPIPTETPSPSPPLVLPVRALALNSNGDLDIDGTVETSLSAPESSSTAHRWQHSPGGGGFGGGFGGRGGFGGSREGGEGRPPRDAATPVSLDVRVTGHIARNALTRMTISQTRRVVLDGLTYSNVGIWTIDVIR